MSALYLADSSPMIVPAIMASTPRTSYPRPLGMYQDATIRATPIIQSPTVGCIAMITPVA